MWGEQLNPHEGMFVFFLVFLNACTQQRDQGVLSTHKFMNSSDVPIKLAAMATASEQDEMHCIRVGGVSKRM